MFLSYYCIILKHRTLKNNALILQWTIYFRKQFRPRQNQSNCDLSQLWPLIYHLVLLFWTKLWIRGWAFLVDCLRRPLLKKPSDMYGKIEFSEKLNK